MTIQIILAILVAVAVYVLNKKYKFDTDAGGYTPSIKDKAQYPKFYVHSVSSALATVGMIKIGIHPAIALGLIVAFGVLYEFSQGFVNKLDIVADTLGGLVAFLLNLMR